jgi:putative sterol carrier protein
MKWLITFQKWSNTKEENIIKSTQYQYISCIFSTIYETTTHRKMEGTSSKFTTIKLRKIIWKSTLKEKKNKILAILYEEVRTFKTFIVMKLWFQLGIFAMVGSYIVRIKQNFTFCLLFMTIFGGYVVSIDVWKCFLNIFNGPTKILKDNKSWWKTFVIWSCGFSLEWGNHYHSS